MKLGQNLQTLRENNLALLLSTIWDCEKISRVELARITGLAPSSVTRLTRELQDIGLIVEIGKGSSSGGRMPVLVSPNPDAGIVICFDLSGSRIRGGVFDAANHLLQVSEMPLTKFGPEAIQNYIFQMMDMFLQDAPRQKEKLLGVGISVPGVVDFENDVISISYNLQLRNYPIKKIIKEKYQIPVYLETDTSVAALAEINYGAAAKQENLIYILISTGIGAGLIKDGEIYQGRAGMGGKRGHIVINPQGPMCICGKRGCLEAIAGRNALLENARNIFSDGRDDIVSGLVNGDIDQITLPHISKAAQLGSTRAKELINSMAAHIAYAISLYITILDIPLVIIGGEVPHELGDIFTHSINQEFAKYRSEGEQVDIVQASLKRDDFLKSISKLTIQQILLEHF